MQELLLGIVSRFFHVDIQSAQLGERFFSLSDGEQVEKLGNGFGIEGAVTAADHDRAVLAAIRRTQRHSRKLQYAEHRGIAELILQRKAEKIKIFHGIVALQGGQRQVMLAHFFLHIRPRREHTLAPNVGLGIQRAVEHAHTHIGHADLVCIGKAECKSAVDTFFIFYDLPIFPAAVTTGLEHTFEYCRIHLTSQTVAKAAAARQPYFNFISLFLLPAMREAARTDDRAEHTATKPSCTCRARKPRSSRMRRSQPMRCVLHAWCRSRSQGGRTW